MSCHLLSLLLHLSYEPQQGHNHLLSQWASVCALLSAHTILLCKKIVQRVPSVQQQTTQTFLNETSQTQRQIPVKSIGRYKLFRCVPDCQEGFCKCSNEVWTAPRQDCQKLIPDCLMYSSSSSSFQPSCLSLLLFSLGIKWTSNYGGRNKTRNKKESVRQNPSSRLVEVEASNSCKMAPDSHRQGSQARDWSIIALQAADWLKNM